MSEQNRYIYEFGPFRLDAQKRLLWREGEIVPLQQKAFDMLLALVERCGRVVKKDELMKSIWPDTTVEEGNLSYYISGLRKTLGDDTRRHEYIVTIPGEGYQFVAGVRATFDELEVRESTSVTYEEEEETGPSPADSNESLSLNPQPVGLLPQTQELAHVAPHAVRRRNGTLVVASLVFVGASVAFLIFWLMSQRRAGDRATAAAAAPFREMDVSRLTTSGKITHAAISSDGKYVAHVTVDAEGDTLWVRRVAAPTSVRVAGPAPSEYVSVTFSPDGDWIYYVALDRNKGVTTLFRVPVLGGPSSVAAYDGGPVAFSPDGSQIAYIKMIGESSHLFVANADGANERELARRMLPEYFRMDWNAPAWSPDGKTIACQASLTDERGDYETIVGVSVEDGSQSLLTAKRWSFAGQPVWLADGSGLLVTGDESATTPVQVWHVALESGETTRVTQDLNNYYDLSLTRDGTRLAAVQEHIVSDIWIAPVGDSGRARRIASEAGWIQEMVWTPDGRILYRSNAGGTAEIWVMNADGSNQKQLTSDARASRGLAVSPDGRHIFFSSDRAGRYNIWRADAEGRDLTQMTFGEIDRFPSCTPDGKWVVFQRREIEPRLWRVPAEGGESAQLTDTRAMRPDVSPDGAQIAFHYLDPEVEKSRWRIGIVSAEGGPRLRQFDFPPTVTERFVRWTPDRRSIAFVNNTDGLSDVWTQPLDGGEPKRLTDFRAEQIIAFNWSPDGRTLALVRGIKTRDVVLISQHQR